MSPTKSSLSPEQIIEVLKAPTIQDMIHKAYELGRADASVTPEVIELNLPKGWRLLNEGYNNVFGAIGKSTDIVYPDALSISVRKFLEALDFTQGTPKLKLKKGNNGSFELEI